MTEDEARQKWCPFVRETMVIKTGNPQGIMPPAANMWTMENGEEKRAKCIGSDCMAWREKSFQVTDVVGGQVFGEAIDPPQGYCGLAGKP